MTPSACPCCLRNSGISGSPAERECPVCRHRWREDGLPAAYYAGRRGRNSVDRLEFNRKIEDRLASIQPLLVDGMRILEIGCAEGHLGARIKQAAKVTYVALEISADAESASARLDRVIRAPAAECGEAPFDLILAFHVLEHIPDAIGEIGHWKRLMRAGAHMLVEVPDRSGHPLLERDANPEHAHQFTPASLLILMERAGMQAHRLTSGHFESSVYTDSLRLLASQASSPALRNEQLQARFLSRLGERFVVYAAGGDFRNYVEPLLPMLPVVAICDSDPASRGRRIADHSIQAYEEERLRGLPVLIASLRHKEEIAAGLRALGVPGESIHGLDDIYGRDDA